MCPEIADPKGLHCWLSGCKGRCRFGRLSRESQPLRARRKLRLRSVRESRIVSSEPPQAKQESGTCAAGTMTLEYGEDSMAASIARISHAVKQLTARDR